DRQWPAQIGDDVLDPLPEWREPGTRCIDHRRRPVECDDATAGQAGGEQLSDTAAPAAGIEDALVAVEREAVQHDLAPARLRVGDAVVGPGVPVAGHGVAQAVGWCGSGDAVAVASAAAAPL